MRRKTILSSYIGTRVHFIVDNFRVSGVVENHTKDTLKIRVCWLTGKYKIINAHVDDVEIINIRKCKELPNDKK